MKNIGFALAMVLGIGCGGGDKLDGFIGELEGYKTKMCACTEKECTEKVFEEYKKWENEKFEPGMKGTKKEDVPKEKIEKFKTTERAMKDCRRKYRDEGGGDVPTPTPPTP